MWSTDQAADTSGRGWLESARRATLESQVSPHLPLAAGRQGGASATSPGNGAAPLWSGRGGIDDDEHLAAYNAFLARLSEPRPGPGPDR